MLLVPKGVQVESPSELEAHHMLECFKVLPSKVGRDERKVWDMERARGPLKILLESRTMNALVIR